MESLDAIVLIIEAKIAKYLKLTSVNYFLI